MSNNGYVDPETCDRLGIKTSEGVDKLSKKQMPELITGLLNETSLNIIAGSSGLGKTAFCMQVGLCVATGTQFLSYPIENPGSVLYCDSESNPNTLSEMRIAITDFLGTSKTPENFYMWNPYWHEEKVVTAAATQKLFEAVRAVRPRLVILDTLRNFFPGSIDKQDATAKMISNLRSLSNKTGCSWLLVHHVRKQDKEARRQGNTVTLRDGNLWFEEVAGTHSLINSTDTRIGVEPVRGAQDELMFGGFRRVTGILGPFKLIRRLDDEGAPRGYAIGSAMEQLSSKQQNAFGLVPEEFTFTQLREILNWNKGSISRLIWKLLELRLIKKDREEVITRSNKPTKIYTKARIEEYEDLVE